MPKKLEPATAKRSRARQSLTYADIQDSLYLDDSPLYPEATVLILDRCISMIPKTTIERDSGRILCTMNLSSLAESLTHAQLRYVLKIHREVAGSNSSVEVLRSKLASHVCSSTCPGYLTALKPKKQTVKPIKFLGAVEFPPAPMSKSLEHRILTEFIKDCSPEVFEERGCIVCGQLTSVKDLIEWSSSSYDLRCLERSEATRAERFSSNDIITNIAGPVLAPGASEICLDCDSHLQRNITPPMALCNGFWVGEVPEVLQNLTFAEQQMIARIRHNICVMRVASGRGKLTANAVMLSNPTVKVYHALPPSKDEMSEVLAYIHLGSSQPTMDDFRRTPMLVRRARVQAALEWLKLNHTDYQDLEISKDNLASYELEDVVCSVDWRPTESEDSGEHIDPLTRSGLEDDDADPGTESGPCSYRLHGLTGVQFDGLSMAEIKLKALHHMNSGYKSLGIGHGGKPVSMYDNPSAYPSMFPWLFPYGKGGIGNEIVTALKIGEDRQKRQLLMYFDKRFQVDLYFPMIAFNHSQMKNGSTGSYLVTKRKDFHRMAKRLLGLNSRVVQSLAERLANGEKVTPETDSEKECFQVLNDLDHVGGHVQGSLTSKKYMQNELWSLISHMGAPTWFVTISPTDSKHPISLYYADSEPAFSPALRGADERERLVAQNPVAAARFFHFLVVRFIEHVLGYGTTHPGVFGETSAYYGTVEQQGRLTLHLHMVIWIRNAPSPQMIRDKMLGPDGEQFQEKMIRYLESCHQGHLNTGSLEDIYQRFPRRQRGGKTTVHDVAEFEDENDIAYKDPTQTMPDIPPPFCADPPHEECQACNKYFTWREKYLSTIDDLVSRSNVHTHYALKSGSDTASRQKGSKYQRKGCLNKDGVCNKRFPRDIELQTTVDQETGSITMKHLIPMINTITNVIVYLIRSNSDSSCLLSGTALKAIVAYVANYITKPTLKTHHIMSTMKDILENKLVALVKDDGSQRAENARTLMRQIINALTAKMEIGSPMASMYLLGNPDHYTSHEFKLFWWKTFVGAVLGDTETDDAGDLLENETDTCKDMVPEKVFIGKDGEEYTGYSNVDDYIYRPQAFGDVCLYDWIRFSQKKPQRTEHVPKGWHKYTLGHPDKEALVKYDPAPGEQVVANFVGGALPRRDQGDREFYCCTMLTLFQPWRKGTDLKGSNQLWDDAFSAFAFNAVHRMKMEHFHVKHECRDEKDDYHKQLKVKMKQAKKNGKGESGEVLSDVEDDVEKVWEPDDLHVIGPECEKRLRQMQEMERVIRRARWLVPVSGKIDRKHEGDNIGVGYRRPADWKKLVEAAREAILDRKKWKVPTGGDKRRKRQWLGICKEDVNRVEPVDTLQRLYPNFAADRAKLVNLKEQIIKKKTLNDEQQQAFLMVANHATSDDPKHMTMYLGGMGGTGKSRVLYALVEFFERRNEGHRFLILAPTGTAAAGVGGSTYHWALGIRGSDEEGQDQQVLNIRKVFDNLDGVEYIFIDEISMIGCKELYRISARICTSLPGQERTPFGGINMIFAGDFAQLAPVRSTPLYGRITPRFADKVKTQEEEAQLGRGLWQQVTDVVILKKPMRQKGTTDEDLALRTALENLRYAACTPEDVAFLKGRIAGDTEPRPNLADEFFRNSAVIVVRNTHRDRLNELGVERFARDTGRELHSFYSVDTKPSSVSEDITSDVKSFDRETAEVLWNIPHATSDHMAGLLRLCVGMPIIIRHNDATELCITKGQEATVHSWVDGPHPAGWQNVRVLETLFVELVGAPKKIELPGLPTNVVPLTRASRRIICTLPNDTKVKISRSQVEILPLFAMTDYASQGKTREANVVDISGSRTVNSVYTALSRGTSAKGTAIVQSFPTERITDGITGWLRQEFRELELLNEITRLKYENKLPDTVKGQYRNALLRSYMKFKGEHYDPNDQHSSLAWKKGDAPRMPVKEKAPEWRILDHTKKQVEKRQGQKRQQNTIENIPKRRRVQQPLPHISTNTSTPLRWNKVNTTSSHGNIDNLPAPQCPPPQQSVHRPLGPTWDGTNWSCGYDSIMFILWNVWSEKPAYWTNEMKKMPGIMGDCADMFIKARNQECALNGVRDAIRHLLHVQDPASLPSGENLTALDDISTNWLAEKIRGYVHEHCTECGLSTLGQCVDLVSSMTLTHRGSPTTSVGDWFIKYCMDVHQYRCERCQSLSRRKRRLLAVIPEWMCIFPSVEGMQLENILGVVMGDSTVQIRRLAGVVYGNGSHFTSRFVDGLGQVWHHDGMEGTYSTNEGSIHNVNLNIGPRDGYRVVAAVYVSRPA